MNDETEKLIARCLERERHARNEAEHLLEAKSMALFIANQNLQSLTESLEIKVQERTQELKQSRDIALQANEAKSIFLANVSHELRTPLNAIIGLAELMEDLPMDSTLREYHGLMSSSSSMLLERINELLDLSKIEAGRMEILREEFKLRALIEEAVDVLSQSAFSKGIDLISYIAPEIPDTLIGDPLHIRQIITNLLNNAIKFTEEGGVALAFTNAKWINNQVELKFFIEDTGIGMTPEAAQKVFKPFQQAESNTSRRYGGTGLGLTLCRSLAESMGGSLYAESTPDKGSIFRGKIICGADPKQSTPSLEINETGQAVVITPTPLTGKWIARMLTDCGFTASHISTEDNNAIKEALSKQPALIIADCCAKKYNHSIQTEVKNGQRIFITRPLNHCTQCPFMHESEAQILKKPIHLRDLIHTFKPAPLNDTPKKEITIITAPSQTLRILIADDNRVNQIVIQKQLEKLGHPPTQIVDCGVAAVAAAEQSFFDLILMDCEMPEMDGLEATRRIRQSESPCKNTIIAALTAHALSDFQQKCDEAGMNHFLSKPIKLQQLSQLLAKIETANTSTSP
jgi:signal transduction histidine kinase/CheY-like chemotaxis protein